MAIQADGKVLLGGHFSSLQPNGTLAPTTRWFIARVNGNGTLDPSFDPKPNNVVYTLAVQADGKVLLGGYFSTLQPNSAASSTARRFIARVNADGTVDAGFNPNPEDVVLGVALQADGKVLLGGYFDTLQPNGAGTPIARVGFARLYNEPAAQTLFAPARNHIIWQRGGSAPELSRVMFEASPDGGVSWQLLDPGRRIGATPNWELTDGFGFFLTEVGKLRARGVTNAGYLSGTSGLVEQVGSFNFSTDADGDGLRDAWERAYWPTTAGHTAGDDFDRDGLTELQELAFGRNPTVPDAALQPAAVVEGGYLTFTLTKRLGVTYEVQSAGTLLYAEPNAFSVATTTVLLDNATTLKVRDNILIGTPPARFLRVKVTAAP